jgi:hypothetical protein
MVLVISALVFVTLWPAFTQMSFQDVLPQLQSRFRIAFADNHSFSGLC